MCVVAGTYTKVVTYKIGKSKTKSDGTHLSSRLKRQGQEDCEIKASMGYPVIPCLFKNNNQKPKELARWIAGKGICH